MSVNKNNLMKSIMAKSGYTPIPNKLWDLAISPKSKVVFAYLISQAEKWEPGINTIAKGTGYCRDSVMIAIEELKTVKMLEIISHGAGLRQEYYLLSMEEWDVNAKHANQSEIPTTTSREFRLPPVGKIDHHQSEKSTTYKKNTI